MPLQSLIFIILIADPYSRLDDYAGKRPSFRQYGRDDDEGPWGCILFSVFVVVAVVLPISHNILICCYLCGACSSSSRGVSLK